VASDTDKQSRTRGLIPFKPGQSGNPKGPPKAKTQLYRHFCKYMEMTATQLKREANKKTLTLSQRAALRMAKDVVDGKWPQTKEVIERDEGKVPGGPGGTNERRGWRSGVDTIYHDERR